MNDRPRPTATDPRAAALRREAGRAGAIQPDDAPKLIDARSLTVAPSGHVHGAREAVEALRARRPELFGDAPRGGTPPRESAHGRSGRMPGGESGPVAASVDELMEARIASGKYSRM